MSTSSLARDSLSNQGPEPVSITANLVSSSASLTVTVCSKIALEYRKLSYFERAILDELETKARADN